MKDKLYLDNPAYFCKLYIVSISYRDKSYADQMPKSKKNNAFLKLQRKQLDARFDQAPPCIDLLRAPRGGWIRAIRSSLGMTSAQLGKRLGMSPQGAIDLERREGDESVTLKKLRAAAEALDATLVVALIPNTSLEDAVQQQARKKASNERNRIVHTMRLEDQLGGVEDALDIDKSAEAWLDERRSALWD
jgi:predicted DNA-binding mobile mystery protein A